jgi:hypothetical protein
VEVMMVVGNRDDGYSNGDVSAVFEKHAINGNKKRHFLISFRPTQSKNAFFGGNLLAHIFTELKICSKVNN